MDNTSTVSKEYKIGDIVTFDSYPDNFAPANVIPYIYIWRRNYNRYRNS